MIKEKEVTSEVTQIARVSQMIVDKRKERDNENGKMTFI